MLQAGIKGKKEITVTLDKTAKAMGSGTMDVFATPAMIALMENQLLRVLRLSLRREAVLSVLRLILSMFRLHRLA